MPISELSALFCYVYSLYSPAHEKFYAGFTHDLKKRVTEHNNGLSRATKTYSPWELLYYEAHRNETDARRRETYLKTSAGKQALHKMLRQQFMELRDLSQQKVYY